MNYTALLLTPLICFALSLLILRGLLSTAAQGFLLDQPNARSLHVDPVSRTGGLGIMLGLLVGVCIMQRGPLLILALAGALMLLSVVDDWQGLPAVVRLAGHLAAAGTFVAATLTNGHPLALLVLAVWVGWMTNLYNFMDGADGLAGGMTVAGFIAYGVAALVAGDAQFAVLGFSVAASACAFLLFNFPPARIFMGDAGSVPLGFLAGAVGIAGWQSSLWPIWFPPVVFSPFIVDATVTLAARLLRGEKVWRAHRSHYYQRLVIMGWTHRKLAHAEYLLMTVSAIAGVLALGRAPVLQMSVVAALLALYLAVGLSIDRRWRARVMS